MTPTHWLAYLCGLASAPILYLLCMLAAHLIEEWIQDREQNARATRSRQVDQHFSRRASGGEVPRGDA